MKGQEWAFGIINTRETTFNAEELERKILKLIDDDEVQKTSGIYPYLLSGKEKYLNLRAFSEKDKQKMYQKQMVFVRIASNILSCRKWMLTILYRGRKVVKPY